MKSTDSETPDKAHDDEGALIGALVKLNAQVLGITLGILLALGIFIVTNFLVIKGGPNVGAHLQLLGQFFYGYKVTFVGSLIGSVYAFVVGFLGGAIIGVIYNWVAYVRSR